MCCESSQEWASVPKGSPESLEAHKCPPSCSLLPPPLLLSGSPSAHSHRRLQQSKMTSDHKVVLKECWGYVERDYAGYGGKVLTRLFEEHPETRKHFPDGTGGTVATNGGNVLRKLKDEDYDALFKLLGNAKNICLQNLKWFTDVLVEVMEEEQGLQKAKKNALKRDMEKLISDIDAYYKDHGFAG
ncbi:hypothetical protein Q8A67_005203 [Cirrhinus molitorella]|uniref:Myoglobin n=1 Tax=Cirrhinus molitorella TaxID=172907 RepID=A0AA88PZH9_9TELE|nr:hypothetical protein Q8A67_005203 [Cirrhinus molitorella]